MTEQKNQIENPTPERDIRQSSLIARIRAWLAPPVFPEDEEKSRRAAIINTILLAALVFGILYGLTLPWNATNSIAALIFILAVLALLTFGLINVRRGNVTQTVYFVGIFAWVLAAGASAYFGGVSSPVFASFTVVILAAGLLLGYRSAIAFAAASILYGLLLLYLENIELLPQFQGDSTNYFIRFGYIFVVATFLVYLTNRNITQALHQAEQAQAELEQSNQELLGIKAYLEGTVEENTRQIERRNTYLETAAEIAQNTIAVRDLQEMLNMVVDLIASRFGYYHVGIFMTEENNQWTNLRAASSEGGKQMVARGHRLGVGKQGIVGYVTGIGQPRITQDIDLDRIHSVTKELPETRSEMALPLKVGGDIIGALDIQESVPQAFSDEDISALQIIANQVALAIGNLRLNQEAERRLEEVQRVYGDFSQRAWVDSRRQKSLSAYRLADGNLTALSDPNITLDSENKIEVPIIVRSQKIGVLELAKADALSEWTSEEKALLQTLSDQLGIALDSARLFNETQLRASTEKIIGEINTEILESLDISSILRTTVQKLQKSLELPEVSIKMTAPAGDQQPSSNGNPPDSDEND